MGGIHRWPVVPLTEYQPPIWGFDFFLCYKSKTLLIKQSSCRWFEMHWSSCDVIVMDVKERTIGRSDGETLGYGNTLWSQALICDVSATLFWVAEHIMMTSSNGNIFRATGPLCGEFTGPGEFPTQRPVTRSFDIFSGLRLNKQLSKQPWGWWFETPSWSLWRHCNVSVVCIFTVHCTLQTQSA